MQRRPEPSEYYQYYQHYIDLVPSGDITAILRAQYRASHDLLAHVPAPRLDFRYAPGKWTLKEVVAHVIDTEWVFAARALHFARKVEGALPGVEQDDMIAASNIATRPFAAMLLEWGHVREAGVLLFESFDDETWSRRGVASGREFSVRALAYIIAGHAQHHVTVLKDRYLG
jgi:hypothetical protein